jgi:RNA polymerase sigma factor (sigma-70 family)
MTTKQKEDYESAAKHAIAMTNMELIAVYPEDDYVETFCPKCKKISVFSRSEFDHIRCQSCYNKLREKNFHTHCKSIVEAKGFRFVRASYEEDYIEIECPACERITLLHANEHRNIHCRYCKMKQTAERNGFRYFSESDLCDSLMGTLLEAYAADDMYDTPIALLCKRCGEVYIFNESSRSIFKDINELRCTCSAEEQTANYRRSYKEDDWPRNLIFDIIHSGGQYVKPIDRIPTDIEGSLEYVLRCLPDKRSSEIIRLRYEQKQTLDMIGKQMGLTRERVRQIIATLLDELRKPYWMRYFRYGIKELVKKERVVGFQIGMHHSENQDRNDEPRHSWSHFNAAELMKVEDLELSTWVCLCLHSVGIYTVAELLQQDYLQLIKISKFSTQNVREVASALEQFGFDCNHLTVRSFYT